MIRILKAGVLYWCGVWLTILIVIYYSNGFETINFPQVWKGILWMLGGSFCFVMLLSIVISTLQKLKLNRSLISIIWIAVPILAITLFFELSFQVVSGNINGLSSIRSAWLLISTISLAWSSIAYFVSLKHGLS